MKRKYCPYCMSPIQEGQSCPNCGPAEGTYVPADHHLPPGTVLGGRYLVGRVLGEGGFGITYLGFDLRLELRVAIKEYYPADWVSRFSNRSLLVEKRSGSLGESFEGGRERFLQEARVMARMNKTPQIVGVRDFFQENNTAYIVMEYVDGTTLKELVPQKGGKISAGELLPMVEPLFPALSAMHAQDLIHRDISPDNIMMEKGHVRLLDFGCAREGTQGSKTMTIMLKHGYAPIEQYQHKGQGPWTDVYGLAATLYYCLTGTTPPQSLDRICDEELIPPRQLGADLTPAKERAILRGMGIRRSQRYSTVEEFHAALYQGAEIPPAPEPVMRGDATVALEPGRIPAIPELELVAAEPEPGPVMLGDLTVALEPEHIPTMPEPEPVMPRPEPAPAAPEQFTPRPVYTPPCSSEGWTDQIKEAQSEQEAQRRPKRKRLGIGVEAMAAALLLGLLIWRPKFQTADVPSAPSPAVPATSQPVQEPVPGGNGDVANKDKPLVWFNRQPSNSSTGELDMTALNFNKDTYYVGFDAVQGAELQGQMIRDYIEAHIGEIDRNGDGIIGYVLAIGDIGHNDSVARTRGVRSALDTAVEGANGVNSDAVGTNVDGSATSVKDGKLTINGKEYIVRELASQEMKNSAGATWDAATAGNAIGTWTASFGDQIDVVASNNDGMGMAMFNAWSKANNVPTFGYDANADAVAAIGEGYGGTISQHADVQAYLTLRVLRNALDGVDIDAGIGTADDAGNVLSSDVYKYVEAERSYYALNAAVTAENYQDFLDATKPYAPVANQLDPSTHPTKNVWLNIYNSADNFLSATYQPLLQNYDDLLNLNVEYIGGDGQTEGNITNRLSNPSGYDAFAINMVKTDNAASYTGLLSQ